MPRMRLTPNGPIPLNAGPPRGFRSTYRWQQLAKACINRDQRCLDCGHPGTTNNPLTADHIWPVALGGPPYPPLDGLQTLCRTCNSAKGLHHTKGGAYTPPPAGTKSATLLRTDSL